LVSQLIDGVAYTTPAAVAQTAPVPLRFRPPIEIGLDAKHVGGLPGNFAPAVSPTRKPSGLTLPLEAPGWVHVLLANP